MDDKVKRILELQEQGTPRKEIYKIINSLETIKNIPRKMKSLIKEINTENRIYYNKYNYSVYIV